MLIAILGLWDQAQMLVGFILKPVVRKELAVRQWEQRFSPKRSPNGTIVETSLSDLCVLAGNISVQDEYLDRLCTNMAKGILSYITNKQFCENGSDVIITISHVWERLLGERSDHDQLLILYHVLNHIEEELASDEREKEKRVCVCASYLYWGVRQCIKPVDSGVSELGDDLLRMMTVLDLLHQKMHNSRNELISCLNLLYASFCWMFFLCNKIELSQEILEFFVSYQSDYDDSCKECVRCFILCTFSEKTCNTYFDTAWNQVRKE